MNVKKGMFLVCIGLVMLTLFANIGLSAWDNSSCLYRENLTYSNAWNNENLYDFPVLVVLNDTTINYSRTGFDDLQFYSNDGIRLPKELEIWNVSGNSYVWFRDNITSVSDYAYIYYNCSSPTTNDYTDVWDPNYYLLVMHMNGTKDSSFYGWNGTVTGTLNMADGLVGKAYYWPTRHTGYITVNGSLLGTISGQITLTSLVYYTDGVGYQNFILTSQGGGDDGAPPVTYWLSNWEVSSAFRYTYTHSSTYSSLNGPLIENNKWFSYSARKSVV